MMINVKLIFTQKLNGLNLIFFFYKMVKIDEIHDHHVEHGRGQICQVFVFLSVDDQIFKIFIIFEKLLSGTLKLLGIDFQIDRSIEREREKKKRKKEAEI